MCSTWQSRSRKKSYMVFHRHRTTLLVFSLLKGNGDSIIFSFERDSKAINRSLLLFYFGRYSHLNQRTVRHLGLIFNLIDNVLVTSFVMPL